MEIYERKLTTTKALSEMKNLFDKVNVKVEDSNDIKNFVSEKTFFCEVIDDNGLMTSDFNYRSWTLNVGKIVFCNGEFKILVRDDEYKHKSMYITPNYFVREIRKINFPGMFDAFKEMLEKYNERAKQKDEQIERFLEIVKQF
jgi:hypothetical protein